MAQQSVIRKNEILYILVLIGLSLVAIIYLILQQASKQTIESHALVIAEVVAHHASATRDVLSEEFTSKMTTKNQNQKFSHQTTDLKHSFPSKFLKSVGEHASKKSNYLFSYQSVSKWNIESDQGLDDEFLKWAWNKLESQEQSHPNKSKSLEPVWKFKTINGSSVLRYMYPETAKFASCIECHNKDEKSEDIIQSGNKNDSDTAKQWDKNQLIGALSITVHLDDVEQIAQDQMTKIITLLIITFSFSLILIIFFTRKNVSQASELELLDWESTHDPLTDLMNRRGLKLINHEEMFDVDDLLVCMIDLDHFKPINDTYGHKAGDQMLQAISKAINEIINENDYFVRLGGDEFVVLFSDVKIDEAQNRGELILNAIRSAKIHVENKDLSISASIGIVEIDLNKESLSKGMERADAASYQAKSQGRDQFVIHQ